MCIEGGVCAFYSCLTLVNLRITLAWKTPTEMSSLPLCLTSEVHCFGIRIVHCKVNRVQKHFVKLTVNGFFC